ncbi:hypothetical protein GCM10023142_25630 [Anaerocolumna aminovalerica]
MGNSVEILDTCCKKAKIAILFINKYDGFIIISNKQYHKTIKLSIEARFNSIQKSTMIIV